MKIDFTDIETKRAFCKYVGPLVDGMYERVELLRGIQLSAFEPELELPCKVCTPEEAEMYRAYTIDYAKRSVCSHAHQGPLRRGFVFLAHNQEDQVDPEFLTAARLARSCYEKIKGIKQAGAWPPNNPYNRKIRQLRQQEIAAYAPTLYQSLKNPDDRQSHYTLYCQAVAAYGAEHGFTLDKTMSTRAIHIYSKPFYKDYVIAIDVDKKSLIDALGKNVYLYGASEQRLGDLVMAFNLTQRDNKALKDIRQAYGFGPTPFLPFNRLDYYGFYSLAELEFLIMARFKMYGLIASELETALCNGLMEIEARQNAG